MQRPCPGCGGLHPKRISGKDTCPCCTHPHNQHGNYGCALCLCAWPFGGTATKTGTHAYNEE